VIDWRDKLRSILADQLAQTVLVAAHVRAAEEYAAMLAPGSDILEDTDGAVIAPFRHLLVGALFRRGLAVEPIVGGWRVVRSPVPSPPRRVCACGQPWFECAHQGALELA
jgi:hypothetical protein